jgi:integrase
MKVALTGKDIVGGLTLPPGVREMKFFDYGHSDCVVGFGVRIRQAGSRTWIFQYKYGDKHQRMKLGVWPALSLEKARAKARFYREQVDDGGNPAAVRGEDKLRARETFGREVIRFLARQRLKLKPRSYLEVERHLNRHAKPLHGLMLAGIDRRRISGLLSDISGSHGPIAANRVRASLSTFFAWAVREGMLDSNVVIGTNRTDEVARDRVLSVSELGEIWSGLLPDDYGTIVKLLMLTGQRREEIGALRWSEIDFDRGVIVFPPSRTKNKREHEIHMSDAVRDLLQNRDREPGRDFVFGAGRGPFSGWSNGKESLDARLLKSVEWQIAKEGKPRAVWRLHDIRRSVATHMAENGLQPHVIEAVLNHVSGHKAGVAGVYNRATYATEKVVALVKWADHLRSVVLRVPIHDLQRRNHDSASPLDTPPSPPPALFLDGNGQ